MPPINGEIRTPNAEPARYPCPQYLELFSYFEYTQPISWLARLVGKFGLKQEVVSPKALYQAEGQAGNTHTRAWLTRDLKDNGTATLFTDVVRLGKTVEVVPGSEQIQAMVNQDGELRTAPRNLVSPEVTLSFIEDCKYTAVRVGQEISKEAISRTSYMSP